MLKNDLENFEASQIQKPSRLNCCKKKVQVIEEDSNDEEALDHVDLKLNLYLQKQKDAIANWKKIKFRLMIISKFSSLKVLQ